MGKKLQAILLALILLLAMTACAPKAVDGDDPDVSGDGGENVGPGLEDDTNQEEDTSDPEDNVEEIPWRNEIGDYFIGSEAEEFFHLSQYAFWSPAFHLTTSAPITEAAAEYFAVDYILQFPTDDCIMDPAEGILYIPQKDVEEAVMVFFGMSLSSFGHNPDAYDYLGDGYKGHLFGRASMHVLGELSIVDKSDTEKTITVPVHHLVPEDETALGSLVATLTIEVKKGESSWLMTSYTATMNETTDVSVLDEQKTETPTT